ncbi:hypothetical protein ABW636_03265 [Aquimarina sp. 2201CG1-2-11]|uniref:hypothetical protein n=1 Tax=Aquimarina discodermiae TaxID=3231043 RepID=UPI0034625A63
MKNIMIIIFFVNCTGLYAQNTKDTILQITASTEKETLYTPKEITVSKIVELTYPIKEYETMIMRCNELADKLIQYKNDIQRGSMTKAEIKHLKKDMTEAKLLNYKLGDYTAIYNSQDYPLTDYLSKEILDNYQDFSKIFAKTNQYASF